MKIKNLLLALAGAVATTLIIIVLGVVGGIVIFGSGMVTDHFFTSPRTQPTTMTTPATPTATATQAATAITATTSVPTLAPMTVYVTNIITNPVTVNTTNIINVPSSAPVADHSASSVSTVTVNVAPRSEPAIVRPPVQLVAPVGPCGFSGGWPVERNTAQVVNPDHLATGVWHNLTVPSQGLWMEFGSHQAFNLGDLQNVTIRYGDQCGYKTLNGNETVNAPDTVDGYWGYWFVPKNSYGSTTVRIFKWER